jgi:membrane-associated protein
MLLLGAIISVSGSLGYALPAIIGLESLGIPSPGETALILAAVLASQGKLQIWLVIVIAAASAIVGDNIGYLLGHKLGRRVLTAPGPMQGRRTEVIDAGDRFFAKHGPKAVFIGRWIALVRFAVAWLAGIEHMPFRTFFIYNALGGIAWATAYGLVGFYAGKAAADAITKYGVYAALALVVLIIAFVAWRLIRERRRTSSSDGVADPSDDDAGGSDGTPEARDGDADEGDGTPEAPDGEADDGAGPPEARDGDADEDDGPPEARDGDAGPV